MGSLQFITPGGGGGGTLTRPISPGIVNADVDPAAGIVKSKLAALGLVDADVAAGAAIGQAKLALLADPSAHASRHLSGGGDPIAGLLAGPSGTPTLGALQTNIASQYISGSNTRFYIRVTVSATAVTGGAAIALVTWGGGPLAALPYPIVGISEGASIFGDAVTAAGFGYPPAITALTTTGFTLTASGSGLLASNSYGFIIHALS